MNTHQIVEAYDLLRKREDLQAEQKRLPGTSDVPAIARISLDFPVRGAPRGARVEFRGPTVGLIVDMLGSQLSREIDSINRRLADLGVTEDMAAEIRKTEDGVITGLGVAAGFKGASAFATKDPPNAPTPERAPCDPQDPAAVEIILLRVGGDGEPCDCPTCQAMRGVG